MSFFFGGGSAKMKPQFSGLAIQTSASSVPIGLWYGKNRGSGNLIWQGDFKSEKAKSGGKGIGAALTGGLLFSGGGGSSKKGGTGYQYSGSYELGLCWGEIQDITRVWKDQSKVASYASLGFSLFTGTNPQSPWGYLVTAHPDQALGYPDIAYLAVPNYDLGQTNTFPQHSFEVEALLVGTGVGNTVEDADPALIIKDFLSNEVHGVGFNTSILSNLLSTGAAVTTGDSAFQTYCQAMGFALSPFLSDQQPSGEIIQRWADLCNTAVVWTGYSLKFHPYGPDAITLNGVTYLPDFDIRYSLTDNDYVYSAGEDPVRLNRTDPADAFNGFSLVISNRDNEYNELPVPWRDQGLVDQFGFKNESSMSAREVTSPDMAAVMVTFMGQRKAYIRNTFEFTLPASFCRLEPMDVLECTDPRWGTFTVLIQEINEADDDKIGIVAEEYNASISTNSSTSSQPVSNTPVNTAAPPGPVNPPILFEPPSSLAGSTPQVWAVVSGGDGTNANDNWGGCYVWISTDNATFNQIGDIIQASRQGKLTAALATYGGANPDTGHTLGVSMAMSGGELDDASSAYDAQNGATVSYVQSAVGYELMSFENATLTGTDAYDLDILWRHQYGTTVASHAIAGKFARLDEAVFRYDLPEEYIGKTLYLKFQSYNIFGGALEDISSVAVYTYVPTGVGFGTGTGGIPAVPTGLSGTTGSVFTKLTWTANPTNDNVSGYQVWRATGSSRPFGSASLISTTSGTEYVDAAVTALQAYTYFLVAVNAIGSSANTAGINLTPSASTAARDYGFAFQWPDPVVSKPLAYFDSPIAWTLPSGLTNSQGTIGDSPSAVANAPFAQTDFDIQSPPGVSIGKIRFAASSLVATFVKTSTSAIPLGQSVAIIAPFSLNGIAGMVYGSLIGTTS